MIKKLIPAMLLALSLMAALTGCGGGKSSESDAKAGNTVSFQTTDLDGNAVDSAELFAGNKITMINIWGTYCGPCIDEMPELEELSEEYADKGAAVVGLVVDVTEADDSLLEEAQEIVRDTGVTYRNLRAWDGFKNQLSAVATPTTYFVDSTGRLVGDPIVGASVAKYKKALDELLAE